MASASASPAATAFRTAFADATRGRRTPYPWQERLALADPMPRLVDAPTGSGKTEAVVMAWLWRRWLAGDPALAEASPRRLVIVLPMRVLVEQTAERARGMVERLEAARRLPARAVRVRVLLGGATEDDWALDPAADQIIVATVDMAVSRALCRGYARSRGIWPIDFGLINEDALWIFDEIQQLDAALATSVQLDVFRAESPGERHGAATRTVWMSATLRPRWLTTVDHPEPDPAAVLGVSDEDRREGLGRRLAAPKTLRCAPLDPNDPDAVAKLALAAHDDSRPDEGEPPWLTVVLRNTVARALATYDALQALAPEAELLLLHSRFRPPDREERIARLDSEPGPAGRVLVTTQVIEAGIDLDASALVSDLCPWANLVQRAGRLNRAGARAAATLHWIDPPGDEVPAKLAPPYPADALEQARHLLRGLDGVNAAPDALRALAEGAADPLMTGPPAGFVLRRPDLRALFDTSPTLDGDDDDVRPYIRLGDDLDVQVAWREKPHELRDQDRAFREELCPVPLADRKELLKRGPRRWSYAARRWERLGAVAQLLPGDVLVLPAAEGGYDPTRGWDPGARVHVEPVTPPGRPTLEANDADELDATSVARAWTTVAEHTDAVVAELERDLAALPLSESEASALRLAARWHDAGKAHPVFQLRLGADPRDERGPWAKSGPQTDPSPPTTDDDALAEEWRRRERGRFRHEVASALMLDAAQVGVPREVLDLALYLVGAHHGALRVPPRLARAGEAEGEVEAVLGVRAHDAVPVDGRPVELGGGVQAPPLPDVSLELFELGSLERTVWLELVEQLLARHGAFRLAYLEALLRVADWRGSAR
jgi:CRISPR-associated endonuclease/helicase Cas3